MSLLLLPVVTIPRVDILGTNEPKVVGLRRLDLLLMGVLPSIKHRLEDVDDLLYHIPFPTQTILPTDLLLKANTLLTVLNLCILIYTGITAAAISKHRGVELAIWRRNGYHVNAILVDYNAISCYYDHDAILSPPYYTCDPFNTCN